MDLALWLVQDDPTTDVGVVNLNPTDLTMGFLVLPPVISIINQRRWSQEIKALIALGVCVGYAAIVTLIRGETNWLDWRNATLQVCASTLAAYKLFWNPSNLGPHLETLTTHPPCDPADPALPPATLDKAGLPPATVERAGADHLEPAGEAHEADAAKEAAHSDGASEGEGASEDYLAEPDNAGGASAEPDTDADEALPSSREAPR